jgi:hypothetical protein
MKKIGVQEYLSLGYIYLLIVGLLTNVIFYNFVGINILDYSTFLDILITPVNHLTSNVLLPVTLLVVVTAIVGWARLLLPRLHRPASGENATVSSERLIFVVAVAVLILFLGLGIGRGLKVRSQIAGGNIQADHIITFSDSRQVKVKMVGQNSLYLFYVSGHEKQVSITPVGDNILQIKRIAVQ